MPPLNHDPIALLPFTLLSLAVMGSWIHRHVWMGALLAACVAGYVSGALQGPALIWLALFAYGVWFLKVVTALTPNGWQRSPLVIGVSLFAPVMVLVLPGFSPIVLVPATTLSAQATPYGITLGFPKVVVGILLLGLLHPQRIASWHELLTMLRRVAPIWVITTLVVMAGSLALHYVAFEPKWLSLFLLLAPINLLFTVLSEEAFFRGFIQREAMHAFANHPHGILLAVLLSALLFGLAHVAGGWQYVLLASLAGMGYGWAYARTERVEASMAVHFGVNAVHFLLFTYPRLVG